MDEVLIEMMKRWRREAGALLAYSRHPRVEQTEEVKKYEMAAKAYTQCADELSQALGYGDDK